MNKKLSLYGLLALMVSFASCIKKEVTPLKDGDGQTLVKILGGDNPAAVKSVFIDFVNAPQRILAIDIRRDANGEAELQTPMTVVIKDDTAAVRAASASFVKLPDAFYTLQSEAPRVGGSGGTYTFEFKAGEFAKQIYIVIPNATLMDPSSTYALGFTIQSISSRPKTNISYAKSLVVTIGAKNAYDGVYENVFTNYHPSSNPGYTGDVTEVEFITTGANKCKIFWPLAGAYANPAILGGGFSYFGIQEPEYTVNVSTNAVTVQNVAPGAVTFYTMATGYRNDYDPSNRTFYVKFGYSYTVPGVFDAACREWTQTLKYLRSR